MLTEDQEERKSWPELLAPAGSWDALRAAVGAGADAVYLGGKRFSARVYADNFDDDRLIAALEYAHRADVNVYVTVNTLLAEGELAEAGKYLLFLYEQGVDGVLVQDPGLISLAQKRIPGLPLHASTQMTLYNHAGVEWAREMGLRRVVLARELGAAEIQRIGDLLHGQGMGLEIFIHGALCYSYSGQCLLSSVIGGRSGNRGRCAQPCRKPYVLAHGFPDEFDRIPHPGIASAPSYCLSTRDLSTYVHFDEILRLPVDAVKIEGRMKSPEYVATVVRIYRTAIDAIRGGSWVPRDEDVRDLLLAFNREFTSGHLLGEPVMGAFRPDHIGLPVGRVVEYDPRTHRMKIRVSGNTVPEKGDGIHVVAENREERGLRITGSPYRSGPFLSIFSPQAVPPNASVFVTDRASLNRSAEEAMKRPCFRQIPVELELSWKERRLVFRGSLHRRVGEMSFSYESPFSWDTARTQPLTTKQIISQLQKSGDTPFQLLIREIRYAEDLFLPLGALNEIRRDFLSHLGSLLHERRTAGEEMKKEARLSMASCDPLPGGAIRPPALHLSVWAHTLEGARAAIEGEADSVCLEAGSEMMSEALDLCREEGISLIWIWPRIIREARLEEWLSRLTGMRERGLAGLMVASPGAARAVRMRDPLLPLWGAMDLNIWNHCTVRTFAPLFHTLMVSPELSLRNIRDLTRLLPPHAPSLGCMVQGNLEVMISENCPDERMAESGNEKWGLLDARDRLFPMRIDEEGRTHIYNAVETCYIDHLHTLQSAGIGSFFIDGRYRSPRYIRGMVSIYREGLRRMRQGGSDWTDLKEEIQKMARGGITLGPLIRGLREDS